MPQVLTLVEMHARFEAEWILVGEPDTDEALEVRSGTVLFHSKDRDEVYRKAIELQPVRFAMVYTGSTQQNSEIVLRLTTRLVSSTNAELLSV